MKLQLFTALSFFAVTSATASSSPPGLRRQLDDCAGDHDHDCDGVPDHDADNHGSSDGCFSKFTTVGVQGKGIIQMDELEIGDFVRVDKDKFSQVYSFAHRDGAHETDFLQIFAESDLTKPTEAPIEMTPRHMLFVNGNVVRADSVKVGDMLNDSKTVTDIKSVKRAGVFAPFTRSGVIMVNGIKASTYVALMDHVPFNQHYLTHMFLAPQRLLCGIDFSWCENETYTTGGFSNWSNWAIQLYMKANNLNAFGQHLLTAVCVPILSAWYTCEQFFVSPFLGLVTAGFLLYKATSKKAKMI